MKKVSEKVLSEELLKDVLKSEETQKIRGGKDNQSDQDLTDFEGGELEGATVQATATVR